MLIALLPPSFLVFSSWVKLTEKELIELTNVAVIGELIGSTTISNNETQDGLIVGIIKVEKILSGPFSDDFLLFVIQRSGIARISSTVNFKKGQKGLWLLKQYGPTTPFLFSANHPQQFISSSDINKINHLKSMIITSNK